MDSGQTHPATPLGVWVPVSDVGPGRPPDAGVQGPDGRVRRIGQIRVRVRAPGSVAHLRVEHPRPWGSGGVLEVAADLLLAAWQPVQLSFDGPSVVLVGPTLRRILVEPGGSSRSLDEAPPVHEAQNLWRPVATARGYGARFSGGFGWWSADHEPVDIFVLTGSRAVERDGRTIELGLEGLCVTGMAATADGYRVISAPVRPRGEPAATSIVVVGRNREH